MVKPVWKAQSAATLVGSMPHTDRAGAIDLILNEMKEIPVWPQLSKLQPEQMMVQYLEGLPGLQQQGDKFFIRWDTPRFDEELVSFYEDYLAVESQALDLRDSRFALGRETGRTFFAFVDALKRSSLSPRAVKGQVVGPFTLLSGLKDQDDRSILYDDRLRDVVVKHVAMKACWQIEHLRAFQCPVIIFLDEPALAGFGSSAFISVSREQIDQLLGEVIQTVQDGGALVGIHVCANTDWLLPFQSAMDIINFDAYNYFDKFALYHEAFRNYIEQGGTVAWGMVPTAEAEAVHGTSPQALADMWLHRVQPLTTRELTVERILQQSIFTPSCGCSGLPMDAAEKVLSHTRILAEILKGRI